MAASVELVSFRQNFFLLLFFVALPSAALSGFGILAIKNERAYVEKSLEAAYGGALSRLEAAIANRLDATLQSVPALFEGRREPAASLGMLGERDPLVLHPRLVDAQLQLAAGEVPFPEALRGRALSNRIGSVEELRVGRELFAVARVEAGWVVYEVDLPQLERSVVPGLAQSLMPGDAVRLTLEPLEEEVVPPSGWSGLMADFIASQQGSSTTKPLAERRLAPPLDAFRLAVRGEEADLVASTSFRNRIIYGTLLGLFYVALGIGVVMTGRTLYREAQISKLKTDFVSVVSHELRTPMTSIRMFIETLELGRATTDEEVKACLSMLSKESERLSSMIDRMLDWARLEAGRREYHPERIALSKVVEQAVAAFRTQRMNDPAFARTTLELDLAAGGEVDVDVEAFTGVVLNLLQNAFKYSGDEKRITVRLRKDGRQQFAIDVVDNGIGIARADRGRVFERFYRADDLLSRRTEGTGLGLAIAKRIVEGHSGTIGVQSVVGKGSTFTVRLPVAPPQPASANEAA